MLLAHKLGQPSRTSSAVTIYWLVDSLLVWKCIGIVLKLLTDVIWRISDRCIVRHFGPLRFLTSPHKLKQFHAARVLLKSPTSYVTYRAKKGKIRKLYYILLSLLISWPGIVFFSVIFYEWNYYTLLSSHHATIAPICYCLLYTVWLECLHINIREYTVAGKSDFIDSTQSRIPVLEETDSTVVGFMMPWSLTVMFSIVAYAMTYFAVTYDWRTDFDGVDRLPNLLQTFHYFSIVTAATVGYGDIHPTSSVSLNLVSSQIILSFMLVVATLSMRSMRPSTATKSDDHHDVVNISSREVSSAQSSVSGDAGASHSSTNSDGNLSTRCRTGNDTIAVAVVSIGIVLFVAVLGNLSKSSPEEKRPS